VRPDQMRLMDAADGDAAIGSERSRAATHA
jgi:hypothetical protein